MNFYAILGIPRNADAETIRSAYRVLARRYHPDRGSGSSSEKFRQVNEAYQTLIDPGTRRSYDLSLQWTPPRVPLVVEPMVAQPGPFPQEDAALFGRFAAPRSFSVFPTSASLDELFDRWFQSLDEW